MNNNSKVGEKIRTYRQLKNLSQEQLAELAQISTAHLGKIERGVSMPTINVLDQICNGMNISLWQLYIAPDKLAPNGIVEECESMLNRLDNSEQLIVLRLIQMLIVLKENKKNS